MSLYQLCEHEGRFDVDMYRALRDDLSWEEVGRIMTAVAVLGDNRYDYNEWHKKNHDKIPKMLERLRRASEPVLSDEHAVTLEDYIRELNENREKLEELETHLQAHRSALVRELGAEDGLLEADQVEFMNELADVHKGQIDRIEAAILSKFGGQAAKLDDD